MQVKYLLGTGTFCRKVYHMLCPYHMICYILYMSYEGTLEGTLPKVEGTLRR